MEEGIAFVSEAQVGSRARRGAVWSVAQICLRNGVSLCLTAALARVLSADDYGLVGMVATLTGFLMVFSDMGFSWASVQRKGLTHGQVTSLFWLNVVAGFLLWVLCMVLAPGLARFFGREELITITSILGATFAMSGVAVQPMALLKRAMDFRVIAEIEIAATICGAVSAIAVAVSGGGYWALVAQGLISAAVRSSLVLLRTSWRFKRPVKGTGVRELIALGGLLSINDVLIFISRNLDGLLIGRVWGARELGLYNRAYFLMLLPSSLINSVLAGLMVPSLSAFQDDREHFGTIYRRAIVVVAYIGTPMAVGLALTAAPAVELVYGPKWGEVATILAWLSIAGISQPVYNTNGWLFTATGRGMQYLTLTLVNTILLSMVFFWTVRDGAIAVAQGYGVAMGLVIPLPALWYSHRVVGLTLTPTLRALAPVAVLNALLAVIVWLIGMSCTLIGVGGMATFAMQVVTGVFAYLAFTPIFLSQMLIGDLLPMLPERTRRIIGRFV